MASVARVGDTVYGIHTDVEIQVQIGEDENGDPIYGTDYIDYPVTGTIITGSSNVFINGYACAIIGSQTEETDGYDSGNGTVTGGSSKVFVNGVGIARNGDTVALHSGDVGHITSGSGNVFAG